MSSFKSSGSDRSVSDNQSSSVTLNDLRSNQIRKMNKFIFWKQNPTHSVDISFEVEYICILNAINIH